MGMREGAHIFVKAFSVRMFIFGMVSRQNLHSASPHRADVFKFHRFATNTIVRAVH